MNKFCLLTLTGIAAAQLNADDNTCEVWRSCWAGHEVEYPEKTPECRSDNDCAPGNYCIHSRWDYDGQVDSALGCWRKNVCMGSGAFIMFEERTI